MQSKPEQDSGKDDFSDFCVLLIEDDEIMRLSLEDRLRLENIPVHAVGDLSSARKKLEKGEIDLLSAIYAYRMEPGSNYLAKFQSDFPDFR